MKRQLKRLTSSILLTAMVGSLLVTNTTPAAGSDMRTVSAASTATVERCVALTPEQMQSVHGGDFWEDLTLVIDVGCGATGLLGVFGAVNPAAVGFCAGWVIGRLISG